MKFTDRVRSLWESAEERTVFLGFDAFIDGITRPVKKGSASAPEQLYETIGELGEDLIRRDGKNCSIELMEICEKIGGNAPICANALNALDVKTVSIGAFGLPEIHPVFQPMARAGRLLSAGNPGVCTALEFQNGKVMLAMNRDLNRLDFAMLEEKFTLEELRKIASEADLLCFLNWSELPGATDIFKGYSSQVLPFLKRDTYVLVDLCDCARKDDSEIRRVLEILAGFPGKARVVLSLNTNEDKAVCQVLGIDPHLLDPERAAAITLQAGLYGVALHRREGCYLQLGPVGGCARAGISRDVAVNTGAGDNFNACLCKALLLGLSAQEAARFATAGAGWYVRHGTSARMEDILNCLNEGD